VPAAADKPDEQKDESRRNEMELAAILALSLFLVAAAVIVHYEFLRGISGLTGRLSIHSRAQVLVIIAGVLVAHVVEVTLYAAAYLAVEKWMGLGSIDGEIEGSVLDVFYFSITTYTTLGIGDVHPRGLLRLIAGFESLNGLVLIGWSASFTYLEMGRTWENASRKA
jgi:Ion channel